MATTNTILETSDGWTAVSFTALTNRGGLDVEFITDTSAPSEALLGHILEPEEGLSSSELPTGDTVYFRAFRGRVVLVASA